MHLYFHLKKVLLSILQNLKSIHLSQQISITLHQNQDFHRLLSQKRRTYLQEQINRVITTNDYDVKQENQNLQSDVIELKEVKKKTLLDDFDIQEVPIKKETSNSKKKNNN